jgi:hypothetical protein
VQKKIPRDTRMRINAEAFLIFVMIKIKLAMVRVKLD